MATVSASKPPIRDHVVRAMTDDGSFRVVATNTTETVREILAKQSATGETARNLADLVTGAVLMRETMAPKLRVQVILNGDGHRGSLVADAFPEGKTRGLMQLPRGVSSIRLGPSSQLRVMRSLPRGGIQQGVVHAPPDGGISRALMEYLQTSEQVASVIAVDTVFDGDELKAAGGYVVQLLPEVHESVLAIMTERLAEFEALTHLLQSSAGSPDGMIAELFYRMEYTRLEESPVLFACPCTQARVAESLATLNRADLEEMLADNKDLEIQCDYCGTEYAISPAQLRSLMD